MFESSNYERKIVKSSKDGYEKEKHLDCTQSYVEFLLGVGFGRVFNFLTKRLLQPVNLFPQARVY